MISEHEFHASLSWPSSKDSGSLKGKQQKNHQVYIDGKPELDISAAKSFKGDSLWYNPEDLLLSSLMSCHMMSYLYACQSSQIQVVSYKDTAKAILHVNQDGSGQITKVFLFPRVIITAKEDLIKAQKLHQKANELCFIANSCNFPVIVDPIIESI